LRAHTIPRITEAAAAAGRPAPRIVVGLPIAVTTAVDAARERARHVFRMYGMMPSYRAMLDREGVEAPGDVAIIGDEDSVAAQLQHLATLGATEFLAVPFPAPKEPDSTARTRALLVKLARTAHTQ